LIFSTPQRFGFDVDRPSTLCGAATARNFFRLVVKLIFQRQLFTRPDPPEAEKHYPAWDSAVHKVRVTATID
jgi:hypothetical protein